MWSYVRLKERVPRDHPLRAIRAMTDAALRELDRLFKGMYSKVGRPSIPPEQLLRALVLQLLYSIRSERLLMERIDADLYFRWFVGLELDDPVWHPTTFTQNHDGVLGGEVAGAFFPAVVRQARASELLSDEHFSIDGTLIEAWAGHKSFRHGDRNDKGGPARLATSNAGPGATTPTARAPTRTPACTVRVTGRRPAWHTTWCACARCSRRRRPEPDAEHDGASGREARAGASNGPRRIPEDPLRPMIAAAPGREASFMCSSSAASNDLAEQSGRWAHSRAPIVLVMSKMLRAGGDG